MNVYSHLQTKVAELIKSGARNAQEQHDQMNYNRAIREVLSIIEKEKNS